MVTLPHRRRLSHLAYQRSKAPPLLDGQGRIAPVLEGVLITLGAPGDGRRKSYAEIDARDHSGRMIALTKKLRRSRPKGGRRSLRDISKELQKSGFVSQSGKPFGATAIARMLEEL